MRQANHQKCLVSIVMKIGCCDGGEKRQLNWSRAINTDIRRVDLASCIINFNVTSLFFEKSGCTCTE